MLVLTILTILTEQSITTPMNLKMIVITPGGPEFMEIRAKIALMQQIFQRITTTPLLQKMIAITTGGTVSTEIKAIIATIHRIPQNLKRKRTIATSTTVPTDLTRVQIILMTHPLLKMIVITSGGTESMEIKAIVATTQRIPRNPKMTTTMIISTAA
jgi:hypothetical protein